MSLVHRQNLFAFFYFRPSTFSTFPVAKICCKNRCHQTDHLPGEQNEKQKFGTIRTQQVELLKSMHTPIILLSAKFSVCIPSFQIISYLKLQKTYSPACSFGQIWSSQSIFSRMLYAPTFYPWLCLYLVLARIVLVIYRKTCYKRILPFQMWEKEQLMYNQWAWCPNCKGRTLYKILTVSYPYV